MKHRLMHGLVALSVIALAACSDTAGPDGMDAQLESLLTLDVAMVAADALIEDVAELRLGFGGGIRPSFGVLSDTIRNRSSRARTVTSVFFDAEGNEQEAYDGVTTASVHRVSEISGEMNRGNSSATISWSGTISRMRDIMITGLEGEETARTANGTGSSAVSRSHHSDQNGDRSYDMTGTSIITDVVHAVPRNENPYPLSGTITRDVIVVIVNGRNGDETRTRHVVITFNGTQFATMTVNGESFEVDLSTRSGRHPFRRRGR